MKIIDPDICPRCGAAFHCSKSAKCWCYEVSTSILVLQQIEDKYNSCLCPNCLRELNEKAEQKNL
jgi:hypothetical protein